VTEASKALNREAKELGSQINLQVGKLVDNVYINESSSTLADPDIRLGLGHINPDIWQGGPTEYVSQYLMFISSLEGGL